MKLTIREANGSNKVIELNKDLSFSAKKGQQFIFSNGFSSYSMSFKDNQKSVEFTFKIDGKTVNVSLNGIVPLLNENKEGIINPTLVLINKDFNEKDIDAIVENKVFNGNEIIDRLQTLISNGVDTGNKLSLISDFQSLVETLDAAAAGGEGPQRLSGVKSEINDLAISDSLFGLQESDRWVNLERAIFSLPIDSGQIVATTTVIPEIGYSIRLEGLKVDNVVEGDKAVYKVGLYDENGNPIAAPEDITITFNYTYKTADGDDIVEVKSVTIPKGQISVEFEIEIVDDKVIEDTEEFDISINSISTESVEEIKLYKENIKTTILDNDVPEATVEPKDPQDPTVPVPVDPTDPSKPLDPKDPIAGTKGAVAVEGEDLVFSVTVTQSVNPQEYDFRVEGLTATDNEDFNNVEFTKGVTYDPATGKITVPAGVTEFDVIVKTVDDNIIENTETLKVTVGDSSAIGYILDNDEEDITITPDPDPKDPNDPKDVASKGATVTEGDTAEFKVKVTESVKEQTATITITSGTADKGVDFLNPNEIVVKYADGTEVTVAPNADGTYSVNVPAGDTTFVVGVKTVDDNIIENTENFGLSVKVADKTSSSIGTILDNDVPEATVEPKDPQDPTVPVPVDPTDPSKPLDPKDPIAGTKGAVAVEGEDLVFSVTVTQSVNPQEYDFRVEGLTATDNEDFNNVEFTKGVTYDPATGKITVPAGVTEFDVIVKTVDDNIIENTETLKVTVGDSSAIGYILDNDEEDITITPDPDPKDPNDPKDVASKGATVTEGDTAEFKVKVTESVKEQTATITITSGTADKGVDFLNPNEIVVKYADGTEVTVAPNADGTYSVNVPAGDTTFVVGVKTVDDNIIENTENFGLSVKVADKTSSSIGTILDNDVPEATVEPKDPQDPTVPVPVDPTDPSKPLDPKDPIAGTKGAVAVEGEDLVFSVTVTQSVNPQEYDFRVEGLTATDNEDFNNVEFTKGVTYDPATGKITVPAGVTEFDVIVKTVDDNIIENTETLKVTVGDSSAIGYILDNDEEDITITPDPDPKDPNDPKDVASKGATVTEGDTAEFKVKVTESVKEQTATITITSGTADKGVDFLNPNEIVVKYADGTEVTVAPNADGTYSVNVPAGDTTFVVGVKTVDDNIIENTENFGLSVKVADKTSSSIGTILDNDVPEATVEPKDPQDPTVPVPVDPTDPSKPLDPKDPIAGTKGAVAVEGEDLVFSVTVTQSVNPQEYDFRVEGLTATDNEDFNNVEFTKGVTYDPATGKITVPAGVTEFDVIVKTVDDNIIENTETLKVTVGDSSAIGYILDNDEEDITITPDPDPKDPNDPKDVASKGATVTEGDTAEFKVKVTESVKEQTATITITSGTADKGVDFLNPNEIVVKYADGTEVTVAPNADGTYSVNVPAGDTTFVVGVKTVDDNIIENTENFGLSVKVADKTSSSIGTILDNDVPEATVEPKDPQDPTVPVPVDPTDPSKPLDPKDPIAGTKGAVAVEGEDLVFSVTVTQSVNPQEYDFRVEGLTATDNEDFNNVEFTKGVTYDPATGKITVPAGVTEFDVIVKTVDDNIIENTETLKVTVGDSSAIGYILDNDEEDITITPDPDPKDPNDPKDVASKGATVTEGDTAEFKVKVTESVKEQTATITITSGTADKGVDFLNPNEIVVKYADGTEVTVAPNADGTYSVNVPAGDTTFVVGVKTVDDNIIENTENFGLSVKVADKTSSSIGTILDNDVPEATVEPKDPQDPTVPVPVDPTDPSKPLDPKDPIAGTKGAVAVEGEDLVFSVTVTQSVNPQEYDFRVEGLTATDNEDFNNVEFTKGVTYDPATGKITVPAGVTEFDVIVKTVDDNIIENTETLKVTVGDSSAIGYILDNDEEDITITPDPDPKDPNDPKDVASKGATVTEGDTAEFKVKVTESVKEQTATITITSGTADKGVDFLNPNEIVVKYADGTEVTVAPNADGTYSVNVPAGDTTFVVGVKTVDDNIIENTENFGLSVKVADKTSSSIGTILDNDVPEATVEPKDPQDPTVPVPVDPTDPSKPLDPKDPIAGTKGAVAVEGEDLVFSVTVTQSVNPQEYDFRVEGLTATDNEDFNNVEFTKGVTYDPATGKITVPAGVTEFDVIVKTVDDNIIENTETLKVTVGDSSAIGYILDNDEEDITITPDPDPKDPNDPKDVASKGATVTEGDTAEFKVKVTESVKEQTATITITSGTADKGVDFLNPNEIVVKYADGTEVTVAPNADGTYSVNVPAGDTTFVVGVKTVDDNIIENTENFGLSVKVADKTSSSIGTILDNDVPEATVEPKDPQDPTVPVPVDPTDPSKPLDPKDPIAGTKGAVAVEGEDLVFSVTVTQSVNPQEYDFRVEGLTATDNEDFNNVEFTKGVTYDPATGKITVPAGVTEFDVIVKTVDDNIIENTETLKVTVGDSSAIGYILDNDEEDITITPDPDPKDPNDPKDVASKGATVTEGDTAEFKVKVTESVKEQTATITITSGTADKGVDFLNPNEIVVKYADGTEVTVAPNADGTYSVNVPAGDTTFVVGVKTVDDNIIENTENFGLSVKVADKTSSSIGTILDNDVPEATVEPKDPQDPTVPVPVDPTDPSKPLDPKDPIAGTKGAVAVEGEDLVFSVTVTQSVNPQEYDFRVEGLTATDNEDFNNVEFTKGVTYDPATGKITVPAGVTEFDVIVKTVDDNIIENTETLKVTVGDSSAIGYILDNDEEDITITPDPDPKDPNDPKDVASKGATVTEGDTAEFKVKVTESVKEQTATITITSGTADKGVDFLNPNEIVVKYADGTEVTVAPNADGTYSVNVPAGDTTFVVGVKTVDDNIIENTENFGLSVKVADKTSSSIGTILDNDVPEATVEPKDPQDPTVPVPVDPTDPSKPLDPKDPIAGTKGAVAVEGEDLVFSVTVTQSVNPQEYDFRVEGLTATDNEDFNNVEFTKGVTYDPATGKITVPAGVTEFDVIVKTVDDNIIENTETLKVTVGDSSAIGYILDNDEEDITITPDPDPKDPNDPKDVASKGATVTEGDTAEFKVKVTESVKEQTATITITSGTADKGVDFLNPNEIVVKYADGTEVTVAPNADGTYSVNVPAGDTTFVVGVKTVDDNIIENTENFGLSVKVADKTSSSIGTILDNDVPEATVEPKDPQDPTVPVPVDPTDPSKPLDPKDPIAGTKGAVAVEGEDLVFSVTVTQSVNPQEYDFRVEGLTATDNEDFNNVEFTKGVTYDPATGKITVPAGVTEFDVIVKTVDDNIIENTETLKVTVGDSSAIGYILDNDEEDITITPDPDPKDPNDPKDVASKGATVTEGDTAEFKVKVTESVKEQTATITITSGTADKGVDFLNPNEIVVKYADGTEVTVAPNADGTYSVNVPAGDTTFVVGVKTVDDNIIENTENFGLSVKVADKTSSSIGTILDNDVPEATVEPKDPQDPTVPVPVDPTDPSKPLDPKDPIAGTKGAVAVEGEDLVFSVTVTQSVNPQEYDFRVEGLTATDNEDFNNVEFTKGVTYDPATGKITVPAGVTEFDVIVKTVDDNIIENTETLKVTVGDSSAIGYILDNDEEDITITPDPDPKDPNDPKDVASKGATVTEGDTAEFKVKVTESVKEQTATITITSGTADKGVDFLNPNEIVVKYADGTEVTVAPNADGTYSVNVPAGDTTFVVGVKTVDDNIIENTENFGLSVKVADKTSSSIGTILDNDVPEATVEPKDPQDPTVPVPVDPTDPSKPLDPKDPIAGTKGAVAVEGEDLVFSVTVTQSVNPQEYDFRVEGLTATDNEDFNNVEFTKGVTYDPATGKITVPAGVTEFDVIVKTVDDNIIENTETLKVTVGDSSAIGYILDNDFDLSTDDIFTTKEDTPYTLSMDDFGTPLTTIEKVKIVELPTNGQLLLDGEVVQVGQELSKEDINSRKLVFKPNLNSDENGSFKFIANDGTQWSVIENRTEIVVTAVADIPTASIDAVKVASNEYTVEIKAALTDTDGSETLTVKISNVPEGADLISTKYEVTKNADGTWNVKVPAGDTSISDTLILKNVPQDVNWVDLKITATATEKNDNTDGKNFVEAEASDATVHGVGENNQTCIQVNKYNLVLTLDISSSMTKNNAMENARAALKDLVDTYGKMGEVKIALNVFATNSFIKTNTNGEVWMTIDEVKTIITNLEAITKAGENTTNYDDAMLKNMEIINNSLPFVDGKTVSYFISDGHPTDGMRYDPNSGTYVFRNDFPWAGKEINQDILKDYQDNFLSKIDESFSIGILGQGTFKTEFLPLMGEEIHLATDVTELTDKLLSTIKSSLIDGDVMHNISGGDGNITIDSIKFEGNIYTEANYPQDGILTNDGKIKLVFDFETGKYKFIAVDTDFVVKNAVFEVTASDSNGDITTFDVGLTVGGAPIVSVPTASIDVVNTLTIDKTNVTNPSKGYSVEAYNLNGTKGEISTDITLPREGFGVKGVSSGNDSEIGYSNGKSEEIRVKFDNNVTDVNVKFSWLASTETASIKFYKNGILVGETTQKGLTDIIDGPFNLKPNNGSLFDEIRFSALGKDDDYLINSIEFNQVVVDNNGKITDDIYYVDLKAALTSSDGRETLIVKISNVPEGATFDLANMKDLGNGVWEVVIPAGVTSIDYSKVKMTVPAGTNYVDLKIIATASIETPCNSDFSKDATDSDATVYVSNENITVYEKGLVNGTSAGDGSNIITGIFTIKAIDGIASITIANTAINVLDLLSGKDIPVIVVQNGELKITGYHNGQVSYEYTLNQAHNHDKSKGEDEIAFKDIEIRVKDVDGDINTGKIKVGIVDDTPYSQHDNSQASGQILVVPVSQVDVGNLSASFTGWTGGNSYTKATDTDAIPGKDTLIWGTTSAVSGYDFKGNSAYKSLATDVINTKLNLGIFTHTNKPITAGTAITKAVLTVELDVIIDGKLVHIKHDIKIDHNETPNSGTATQNRDIVTIEQSSFSQKINVGGKEYLFVIDGFLDKNGNIVKQVYTWEDGEQPAGQTNYNSFELFASIVSTDPLPKIEGNAYGDDAGSNAIFGADGKATNNAIAWQNGVAQADGTTKVVGEYGTLIVDKNGHYVFELNRATYDSFKDEKTATFKYTVTDADGDTRDSYINIKLNGVIFENDNNIGRTVEGSESSEILFGSDGNDYIYAGGGNDIIRGEGGRDVIYGGAGDDTIYTNLSTKNGITYGDVFIDGGTGYDKLVLSGNDDIDLSVIRGKVSIKNIEEIDLTTGNHALKNLKLEDVVDMTDGKNELYIKGNIGDKVQLDLNEWNVQSTSNGYKEYTGKGINSTVKLIIDDEIDITNI